ncbi:MAG: tRNA (guanosine(37)-N1)-methyltransferase TrmD [Clostridia bacterium]|nr:tRNA (guanosine(37)-N1)-methyltransferase TrmD [Clostridia bacterium]
MTINILTILPEMFAPLQSSIIGRAVKDGSITINIINIRDFSDKKHHNTDDYPFGGGAGMLMMPQPIFDAFSSIKEPGTRIYMSPKGRVLNDSLARELAECENITILCGHYEGVDQRVIDNLIDMELSVGDYVLTGGEMPAMIVVDAVSRYVGGVLGSMESAHGDSFGDGLLEYPQYTRPADYKGMKVPQVLLDGNHALINKWRREQQLLLTKKMRPDLLESAELSQKDREFLLRLEENEE